ncbi:MAG: helix-turn-helix domain-containing protein [Scytolyngbya sp. HA4215-MV1]|jgi:DNA-binding MarR family transcriptional regulator|nr:helix-turn-helix domain-containing protein [Scytolyngbya sp. HA4215-MV1]
MTDPGQENVENESNLEANSFVDRPIGRSRLDDLDLSEPLQRVLRIITREREVTLTELSRYFGQDIATIQPLLKTLIEQGLVQMVMISGDQRYQIRHTARRGRKVPDQIWRSLEP